MNPRRPAQGRRHRGGGRGAKPGGGGGMLLGQKISERVAAMRTLPQGIDQRSACRHPDWTGPDDLTIKINELREITDWEKPIYVKVGATRTYYDVKLAVHAGADVVVVDGMQGRHRRHPGGVHRTRRRPDTGCHPAGCAGPAGTRRPPKGPTDRLRRHPHRRRRGQGTGLWAPTPSRWDRSADRTGRQSIPLRGPSTKAQGAPPASMTTSRTAAIRPASARRTRNWPHGLIRWPLGRRLANHLRVLTMEAQTIARRAERRTSRTWNPMISWRSVSRRPPWRGCRWQARTGSRPVSETADVVIVGGGPKGAATAWALAQSGINEYRCGRTSYGRLGDDVGSPAASSAVTYGVSPLPRWPPSGWRRSRRPTRSSARHRLPADGLRLVGVGEPTSRTCAEPCRPTCRGRRRRRSVSTRWPGCGRGPTSARSGAFGWEARGGYGDAHQTAQAFMCMRPRGRRAAAAGHRYHRPSDHGSEGGRVRTADGREISAGVVVATGAWTRPLLLRYGIDIPITVVREQIVLIDPVWRSGRCPCSPISSRCNTSGREAGGRSCSATAIWPTRGSRSGRLPNRATEEFVDITVDKVSTRFPG